ncbi:OmpA family protein [Filimonas effusa]|uniref:Tetratricopeptide repeat protein n=1 Tax=Filimonas effusa TaxID=2508721 RepID=A0A4Q1D4F8_9BACT|nr:OmpA family protein [Filimonas effusa]RXK82816.1 tetratricopeptide repeat protein [Filimonas effusa]
MKRLLLSMTLLSGVITLHAQFSYQYLDAANNFYTKGDYASASSYYEKYLAAGKKDKDADSFDPYSAASLAIKKRDGSDKYLDAVYHLAESYRLLTHYAKAAPYYKEVADAGKNAHPLALFHYGETLKKQGQYAEAADYLSLFINNYKDSAASSYVTKAKQELASLDFIRQQLQRSDLALFHVAAAPAIMNTEGASYAPVWKDAATLVFTSTRADATAAKNKLHHNRLYEAVYRDTVPVSVNKLELTQSNDQHQGVAAISKDGQTMLITRWTTIGKQKSAAIYRCKRNGNGWSDPIALNAMVNSKGTNNQQPYLTPDAQWLIFASDRPGGYGGYDLWRAQLDASGEPVKVENMGAAINTATDEQAPYFHEASATLFFASNGRIGMGGFDVYSTKKQGETWAEPVNIGYPYNSAKDDLYFAVAPGTKSWQSAVVLSSDRTSACCLELFTIRKAPQMQQVTGLVKDCKTGAPLSGVRVSIWDAAHQSKLSTVTTGDDGSYQFTPAKAATLQATAEAPSYQQGSLLFQSQASWDSALLRNPDLCLTAIAPVPEAGEVKVLEHVFYALNKAVILDESKPALDELVQMLKDNPSMEIEISGHTDNTGGKAYNQKLSQQRANNVVAYLVTQGISAGRLKAAGYGDSQPVAPNTNDDGSDNPEGRQKNRRTEFKVLRK